jgi:carboxyl-terminal processing protease
MIHSVLFAAAMVAGCPDQAQALNSAADLIERRYLDVAAGAQIAQDVRGWARAERYKDACQDRDAFMARFNRDLDAYDGHFLFERPGPAGAGDDWLGAWRAESRTVNAGVREVRVLEGNVGYLRLSSFYPWDLAKPKLAAAFALLGDTDALILDLRQNGGGDDQTAGQIVAAFLGPEISAVQDFEARGQRRPDPLPRLELPRYPAARRVAVLVDRRSGSASEFVAYSLQAAGRAKVVGSRSGGVSHIVGEPMPIAGGYALSVPEARPINRLTGRNWEGDGTRPDIPGGDDALYVARRWLWQP